MKSPNVCNLKDRKAPSVKTRFNPPVLVCAIILCMAGTFLIVRPLQLLAAVVGWMGVCWCLRANPICCFKRAWRFCLFFLIITALNLFTNHEGDLIFQLGWVQIYTGGLETFLLFASRLCLMVLYGAALLEGLSASLTARAIQKLLSPLAYFRIQLDALADVVVLSLRFMPLLAREYSILREAEIIRGSTLSKSSRWPWHRLDQISSRFIALIAGMLRHAEHLSLALDSRGYEPGERRTQLYSFYFRPRDVFLVGAAGAYVTILVFFL